MQAARGASLTGDAHEPDDTLPTRPRGSRLRLLGLFAAVALAAYAVDVISKNLAVKHLADRDIELVGELLKLHLVRNPGAAFSTGTAYTEVLTCIAIAAVVVILYLAFRRLGSVGWAVALGLLLAGVSGNLTDRMLREPGPLRGHVIDLFMLPHWPVFNVADICINSAAVLILILVYRGIHIDGTRTSRDTKDADSAPETTP